MPLQPIQFATNSYRDRSLPVNSQRLVNLYAELKPADSKGRVVLHGTPGTQLFRTVGTGPNRGQIAFDEFIFVVSGNQLFRVSEDGTTILLGTITGTQPVTMATNKSQVVIASDSDVYVATAGSLTLHPDISNVTGVSFIDGYIIFAKKDDDVFFISALNNALSVSPEDFTQLNIVPEKVLNVKTSNREVWLFGAKTTVVYYNSGQADFPFSRVPSGVLQRGCGARHSVAEHQGVVMWLGDDLRIYASNGYVPQPISTPPIERQIRGYAAPDGAVGFVYEQESHVFYVLTFAETTWVYDFSTQLWHERQTFGMQNWRVRQSTYQWDKIVCGDTLNSNLYFLNQDVFTDNGGIIQRIATSPPINGDGYAAYMSHFYLDMETGVGLPVGQGSNPQVMLDWSDDGGFTYSSEHWRTFGALGKRMTRVNWHSLGSFYQRTLRVKITDPVKVAIIGAYADIELGDR